MCCTFIKSYIWFLLFWFCGFVLESRHVIILSPVSSLSIKVVSLPINIGKGTKHYARDFDRVFDIFKCLPIYRTGKKLWYCHAAMTACPQKPKSDKSLNEFSEQKIRNHGINAKPQNGDYSWIKVKSWTLITFTKQDKPFKGTDLEPCYNSNDILSKSVLSSEILFLGFKWHRRHYPFTVYFMKYL